MYTAAASSREVLSIYTLAQDAATAALLLLLLHSAALRCSGLCLPLAALHHGYSRRLLKHIVHSLVQ